MLTLPILRRRFGGLSTAALFANGETGIWLDPSDLSTLFQDTAGTTPVTTAGQTVGLALDKSQGLTLGPELVTNGEFATDSDWTKGGSWEITGGKASKPSGGDGSLSQNVGASSGKTYRVQFTISDRTQGIVYVDLGGTASAFHVGNANGTFTYRVQADSNGLIYFIADGNFIGKIDNISVRELPGFHATQATAAARPTYQVDAGGRGYLSFDGIDDFMTTPTITPGTDKVQVFAGVRKLSDAAVGILCETSSSSDSLPGALAIAAPAGPTTDRFRGVSKGTIGRPANATGSAFDAPITSIVTLLGDISGDRATLRITDAQVAQNTGDQGTGNYLAYPLYIGARAGTSLFFNGRLYSLITRFGPNLNTPNIERTESYVANKTGVTL